MLRENAEEESNVSTTPEISVLFDNEEVVVINKPAGLVVHPDGRSKKYTLIDWIEKKYPKMKGVGEPLIIRKEGDVDESISRPGVVHRLDTDTSGVLVLAKTQESFLNLKAQFQNREVKKKYVAFVYGVPKKEEGIIDRPIGRSASDFRKWSATRGAKGTLRDALTEWKLLAHDNEYSYIEAYPLTGRTHQIRVHLKAINHPVLCDKLYATGRECALGFGRVALHSERITFTLLGGEVMTVVAPLPPDFSHALGLLNKNSG